MLRPKISIGGSTAYIGHLWSLWIVDLSNLVEPTVVGTIDLDQGYVSVDSRLVVGNGLVVLVGGDEDRVIDLGDPTSPVVTRVDFGDGRGGVVLSGRSLFVGDRSGSHRSGPVRSCEPKPVDRNFPSR